MANNTTPFLLNLSSSLVNEPCISNDEFLDSLDRIGVWLRVLAAFDSLERYTSRDSGTMQRLAALSNIYLQLGAQFEDQAVSLIAFSVWSKNRDLPLADLFSRIFVTGSRNSAAGSEIERVHCKLTTTTSTRVPVDARSFFREVAEMTDRGIMQFFLAYWRAVPSVKTIPKRHIGIWEALPEDLRRIARSFYDAKHVPRITAAYNKIKHGPQLVVQNPVDRARDVVDSPERVTEVAEYGALDKPTVRLLLAGSRTRSEPTEDKSASVAPFLIDDERAVTKIFFEVMVYQATLLSTLVKMQQALYRKSRFVLDELDKGVSQVVEAWGHYRNQR